MPRCFVAQPFKEPYQARFLENLRPAIAAAGLEAYKVDLDDAADRLVEDIEENIRAADVVLVDITEDNPNVWYELGFSQALRKPLVLISCATTRVPGPYPFDVRGRKVIDYTSDTLGGHEKLRVEVTKRLAAVLARRADRAAPTAPPERSYGEADIKVKLRDWFRRRPHREVEHAIEFPEVDAALGIPPGSAKAHLVGVAEELGYTVAAVGEFTVSFARPERPRRLSRREQLNGAF